jgi:hypothetical protein
MATNRIIVLSNEHEQQQLEELQQIATNLTICCRKEATRGMLNIIFIKYLNAKQQLYRNGKSMDKTCYCSKGLLQG